LIKKCSLWTVLSTTVGATPFTFEALYEERSLKWNQ